MRERTRPLLLELEQRNKATLNNSIARICHGAGFDPILLKRKWLDRPLVEVYEALAEEIVAGDFDPIFVDSAGRVMFQSDIYDYDRQLESALRAR